ncbi:hypothetical protein BDV19DRAFT_386258 [Aspergillus venezuelensis]
MELLIHAGALLDTCPKFVQSPNGSSSAINEAAAADHAKAVELLLDYGTDKNPLILGTGAPYSRYLRQHTLHVAAEAGAEDTTIGEDQLPSKPYAYREPIGAGCNVNIRDQKEKTALGYLKKRSQLRTLVQPELK